MDRRKLVYTIIFTIVGLILTLLAVMLLLPSPEVEDGLTDSDVVQDPLITPEIVEPIDSQDTFNSGNIEDEVDEVNEVKEVEVISSDDNSDIPEDDVRMFLFLGIDRTEERDKTLGIYRSDSIAVLRIDMVNKWAKVLSIPRDTYAIYL